MPETIRTLFLILGDQLFPSHELPKPDRETLFVMLEDYELCTRYPYHKHKLILFLAAMRRRSTALKEEGRLVHYEALSKDSEPAQRTFEERLATVISRLPALTELQGFAVNDKFLAQRLQAFAQQQGLTYKVRPSPMFVTPREVFTDYLAKGKKPFMKTFYQSQRQRMKVLLDGAGGPVGGQWSFDADNRQRLPKHLAAPQLPTLTASPIVSEVQDLVEVLFANHPGASANFWLPTSRAEAKDWWRCFLEERLAAFGPYEDALSEASPWLFHSVLTPLLNTGLLTPGEVIDEALAYAREHDTALNSLEGFVRQVIGWREFIFGIYQHFSDQQEARNYFGHTRQLAGCWWDASTGLPPLDGAIRKALTYGYSHHIERLMVISNTMLLCEIEPRAVHHWFMAMYADSADWVMGPNVYGMGQFSDGGIFATKPYICGSNYWIKMGDAKKGPWQDQIDGLYWRFIDKHQDKLLRNARLGPLAGAYDKIPQARKDRLAQAADEFLQHATKLI